MKQAFFLLTIILLITSCKEDKRVVEKIDFKTEYKFNSEIEKDIKEESPNAMGSSNPHEIRKDKKGIPLWKISTVGC